MWNILCLCLCVEIRKNEIKDISLFRHVCNLLNVFLLATVSFGAGWRPRRIGRCRPARRRHLRASGGSVLSLRWQIGLGEQIAPASYTIRYRPLLLVDYCPFECSIETLTVYELLTYMRNELQFGFSKTARPLLASMVVSLVYSLAPFGILVLHDLP